ncbi:MAG TPA: hypothetical protein VNC21_19170 [Vicinamibacterales bacterium]|nr:hypothetical protein [Vicinamibacterales bacterium]
MRPCEQRLVAASREARVAASRAAGMPTVLDADFAPDSTRRIRNRER